MRKLIVLLALAAGVFATSALPTGAITGDSVEDTEHPFLGLVAFYDEQGQYSHRCSGSLLTPTVFLTAGHCTTDFFGPTATTRVYFQQDAGANYDPQTGTDPVTGFPSTALLARLGLDARPPTSSTTTPRPDPLGASSRTSATSGSSSSSSP